MRDIENVCARHAERERRPSGVFLQFRTDWTVDGLVYALRQTLRYVGFGYRDKRVFYDLGAVIGKMVLTINGEL
jgi:hypothetical protein